MAAPPGRVRAVRPGAGLWTTDENPGGGDAELRRGLLQRVEEPLPGLGGEHPEKQRTSTAARASPAASDGPTAAAAGQESRAACS
ncbi:hypothetical protein RND61_30035 [Streptomyces sp. TRM76323]|uniref:Uncharacterized protein n=1 Tax=Streptomyces tamarix TaxID=3078565 RepID=A0ABU3QU45_9ACTN|nr:hypothetical protein [Streptomyces tamarix]MDT9686277.1 hypothetical protein [Streptomyces tamarix]